MNALELENQFTNAVGHGRRGQFRMFLERANGEGGEDHIVPRGARLVQSLIQRLGNSIYEGCVGLFLAKRCEQFGIARFAFAKHRFSDHHTFEITLDSVKDLLVEVRPLFADKVTGNYGRAEMAGHGADLMSASQRVEAFGEILKVDHDDADEDIACRVDDAHRGSDSRDHFAESRACGIGHEMTCSPA